MFCMGVCMSSPLGVITIILYSTFWVNNKKFLVPYKVIGRN